jgi:hypothetical protein
MAKMTKPKTTVRVKDLAPKTDAEKNVKGGAVGPCNRPRL